MLEMQMQRGRSNAARIMKTGAEEEAGGMQAEQTQDAAVKFERAAADKPAQDQMTAVTENAQVADGNMESGNSGNDVTNFRMQQAISAYEMFMTA